MRKGGIKPQHCKRAVTSLPLVYVSAALGILNLRGLVSEVWVSSVRQSVLLSDSLDSSG